MHLAVIDDNDKVFVEYDAEVFRKLVKKYFEEFGDLDSAFDKTIATLRDLIRNK